jgi:hypothetical protein
MCECLDRWDIVSMGGTMTQVPAPNERGRICHQSQNISARAAALRLSPERQTVRAGGLGFAQKHVRQKSKAAYLHQKKRKKCGVNTIENTPNFASRDIGAKWMNMKPYLTILRKLMTTSGAIAGCIQYEQRPIHASMGR